MSVLSAIVLQDDIQKAKEVASILDGCEKIKVLGYANDAMMGLELVDKHDPDLVIVDLVLKSMDGLELLSALKEKNAPCKKIIFTSVSGDALVSKACSLGADYFMVKPVSDEILLKRVLQVAQEQPTEDSYYHNPKQF